MSVAMVALPMGVALFVPLALVVCFAVRLEHRHGQGLRTALTYVAVTLIVVVSATLAPVKTVDQILERRFVLPQTEFTVAELDRGAGDRLIDWLPRYVIVASTPKNRDTLIQFEATDISLREFVDTVETQTNLRHRFMHCGNGSSILFGGDCCFGVRLR
ncbi:MAG: hypothetical protein AAFU85_33265 [Planctomycetota bacterium]